MSGIGMFFTRGGIIVTDGGAAAAAAYQRLEADIVSGEASGLIVNWADDLAIHVETFNDVQLINDLERAAASQDWNAITRETFAGVLGVLAGIAALPAGPAASVAMDMAMSESFKKAYDAVQDPALTDEDKWDRWFDDLARRILNIVLPKGMRPIDRGVEVNFGLSRAQRQYDPLAIDLDGDGIETVGITGGVLFDHDGDGIKTGTGWVTGDDAFVVLDKNGNGLIDAGAELFGVDYVKSNGQKAANGFDALADLDGNADGLFDAADAQYANVKLWRDMNQDGISQANELQSLSAAGISAIDFAAHTATKNLGNGNTQTLAAGVAGLEGDAVALNLADNPFYRAFADRHDTAAVASLPDMQGAGRLRDLKEAATLSPALAAQLADLQATYRTHQQFDAELDTLIQNWANTGEFDTSVEQAAALGYVLSYRTPDGTDVTAWLELLETFNGMAFVQVEAGGVRTGAGGWRAVAAGGSGLVLTLSAAQMTSLEQSYAALKQSVCDGLVLQTRLKGYMDAIDLQIDANGISLDFSGVETMLADRHASDAREEQETRRWRGGDYASRTTANDGQWSKAA